MYGSTMDRVERAADNSPELRPRETIGRVNNVGRVSKFCKIEQLISFYLVRLIISIEVK